MKRNFQFNQQDFLKFLTADIQLHRGVCFAMTRDWLLSEMSGTRKPVQYYKQVYRFLSQQRVQNDLFWRSKQDMQTLKSEGYYVIAETKISRYEGHKVHSDNNNGFYFISLTDGIGFRHCIGVSVISGAYRVFDANYGEFEHAGGNESLSKMLLQSLIMQLYSHEDSPHLTVSRVWLK